MSSNPIPISFTEIVKHSPNPPLLDLFYHTFLETWFPIASELSSWEDWVRFATSSQSELVSNQTRVDLMVILAQQQISETVNETEHSSASGSKIVGGVVVEYYPQSNCGLISYLVVDPGLRGTGLGRKLIDEGVKYLQMEAKRRIAPGNNNHVDDQGKYCSAIFAEMNSPEKLSEDVISPLLRVQLFHRLNFGLLDFTYIQPALESHLPHCYDLVLIVHLASLPSRAILSSSSSPLISSELSSGSSPLFNSEILFEFLKEFWITLQGDTEQCREMIQQLRNELNSLPNIKILSLAERFSSNKS